jgi:hypothetical protein
MGENWFDFVFQGIRFYLLISFPFYLTLNRKIVAKIMELPLDTCAKAIAWDYIWINNSHWLVINKIQRWTSFMKLFNRCLVYVILEYANDNAKDALHKNVYIQMSWITHFMHKSVSFEILGSFWYFHSCYCKIFNNCS